MKKPIPLEEFDLQKVKEKCIEFIDFYDDDKEYHEGSDHDHYIFEATMEAIYGPDVWDWINSRQE